MSKIVTVRSGVVIQVVIGPDHHRLAKLPSTVSVNEFGVKTLYLKPTDRDHPNDFEMHLPNESPVVAGWTMDKAGEFYPPISNNPTQRTA